MKLRQLLKYLACPHCQHQQLKLNSSSFSCPNCHRQYPIKNQIPIFLPATPDNQEKEQIKTFNRHYQKNQKIQPWHRSMIKRIFRQAFIRDCQTYLDIGCGPSSYTLNYATQHGLTGFGIEISHTAALQAHRFLKNPSKSAVLVASAQFPPFKRDAFDYISCISVLEHLKNHQQTLNNIYQMLKKEKYLFIVVPNSYLLSPLVLWPIIFYHDLKIGHLRHYSIKSLNKLCQQLKPIKHFYNGHLIKFLQLFLEKTNLVNSKLWWQIEKKDINQNPFGLQLNALYQKKC